MGLVYISQLKLPSKLTKKKRETNWLPFKKMCTIGPNEDHKHGRNGEMAKEGEDMVLRHLEKKPCYRSRREDPRR